MRGKPSSAHRELLFHDFDERVFLALYLAALGLTLWAWRKVRVRGKGTEGGGK